MPCKNVGVVACGRVRKQACGRAWLVVQACDVLGLPCKHVGVYASRHVGMLGLSCKHVACLACHESMWVYLLAMGVLIGRACEEESRVDLPCRRACEEESLVDVLCGHAR